MSDISSLSTPTPEPSPSADNSVTGHDFRQVEDNHEIDSKVISTPPAIPNELTPPPSTQIPVSVAKSIHTESDNQINNTLGSTPPTQAWGNLIFSSGLFGEVPTLEAIQDYTEEQLRGLVADLVPALSEARMAAAHSKLQYNLLSIENAESMKRAEVEHEMTRREVQVLKESVTTQPGGFKIRASPIAPHPGTQRNLDLALKHCRELQNDKGFLEQRLRRAKKLILRLDGKNTELTEEIQLLRGRIKQNRDRFNAMRSSGAISVTGTPSSEFGTPLPRATPRTPSTARTPLGLRTHTGSQDAFDALLFAGQVLNEETNSVPSTPSQSRTKKPRSSHIRGAHSLSSLPATPDRSRPITADTRKFTPVSRDGRESRPDLSAKHAEMDFEGDRPHERDSTISASENEDEAYTDVDVPASQASQRATNMLRLMPSGRNQAATSSSSSKHLPASRKLSQSKLTGPLKKDGTDTSEHRRRGRDVKPSDEISRAHKKVKVSDERTDQIGLGIANWPNPTQKQ